MRSQLTAPQRHAVALLAACKPLPDVARDCGACEATVRRWKKIPDFQAAVTARARWRMELAGRAFDRRAAKAIEAAMHAQRELHAYIRHKKELPFQRVLELRRTMEDGARMLVVRQNSNEGLKGVKQSATGLFHTFQLSSVGPLDRIRFSTKAQNRSELLLFMRKNDNFAAAFTNRCENDVNEKDVSPTTPQNPPFFEHTFVALASSQCSRHWVSLSKTDCMGKMPMPRVAGEPPALHPHLCMRPIGNSAAAFANQGDNSINTKNASATTPQKSLIFDHSSAQPFNLRRASDDSSPPQNLSFPIIRAQSKGGPPLAALRGGPPSP